LPEARNSKKKIYQLNTFFKLSIGVYIFINIVYTTIVCAKGINPSKSIKDDFIDILLWGIGLTYTVYSLLFFITGFLSLGRLKKYFPVFYEENYLMLLIATLGLSVPLFLRGMFDILRILGADVMKWA